MIFTIKYDTGKKKEITEREVRDLIIFDFQHDMGTVGEYSDEEIEQMVNESNLDDHFPDNEYESGDYTIIRTK